MVTLALATMPPEGSVTVPTSVPRSRCAYAAHTHIKTSKALRGPEKLRCIVPLQSCYTAKMDRSVSPSKHRVKRNLDQILQTIVKSWMCHTVLEFTDDASASNATGQPSGAHP